MKLTPIKKIIIGLAAMCIVVTLITANNLTSVMMLMAAQNAKANAQSNAVVEQQGTVVSGNTSSGTVSGGTATGNTVNSGSTVNTGSSTSTGGSTSTGSSNAGSSAGTNDTATPDKGSDAGAATSSKKPETKAEIVEYFNKSVNAVKTNAKAVNQKSVTNYLAGTTTISGGISSIYNMLGGDDWLNDMLSSNSQGEATYTGADITAKFPVEGQSWSSKLTEADVKSATCTESNGVYTIEITTIADEKSADVKIGEGHAPKAFNVILPGVVNDNIPGIAANMVGTATMAYPESTVVVTVDAATGNVLTAEYDLKWTINFDTMGIILPFGTKAIYEIAW